MYIVINTIINFEEDINRSFLELRLDLKFPELELDRNWNWNWNRRNRNWNWNLLWSGIGIGIENNGIAIELKKLEVTPTLASGNQEKVQACLVTL